MTGGRARAARGGRSVIKAIVLDIDGVLTDGTVGIGGDSARRVHLRDLDALTRARAAGIQVAFLTGESESEVGAAVARCGGGVALYDVKDKERGLRDLSSQLSIPLDEMCYIGDARRDAPALRLAGLGLVPADADAKAQAAARRVLLAQGGRGAVAEAVDLILDKDPTTH